MSLSDGELRRLLDAAGRFSGRDLPTKTLAQRFGISRRTIENLLKQHNVSRPKAFTRNARPDVGGA